MTGSLEPGALVVNSIVAEVAELEESGAWVIVRTGKASTWKEVVSGVGST